MQDFRGKVAVVTGAASGIGRGIAEHCAQEGMSVVLADVEEERLSEVHEAVVANGARALAIPTDVSREEDVDRLAATALREFGSVQLVFNNAGVAAGTTTWESSIADWQWVLQVNLWGVIHGIRAFVPPMMEQDEGRIVNTASIAGLTANGAAVYTASKHAVVGLSESLQHDLTRAGSNVKASVLCPGFVATNIMDSARNRPAGLIDEEPQQLDPRLAKAMAEVLERGTPPAELARRVFNAIRAERFYILPHPEWKFAISARMHNILGQRDPFRRRMPGLGEILRFGVGNLRLLIDQMKAFAEIESHQETPTRAKVEARSD